MSEKHIPRPEHQTQHEHSVEHGHYERVTHAKAEQARLAAQEKARQNIEHIKALAEQEAKQAHDTKLEEPASREPDSMFGMHQSLKDTSFAHTLARIQRKLPAPARAFSRVVHNPTIDKISAVSAQTVARPSGILGGSLVAFLGSSLALYYSKQYGFKYNYAFVFMLFIGGYAIGAVLELLIWLVRGRKQQYK